MDSFANIGKAVIIQSLGIQKNYSEVVASTVETTDYSNPACTDCKYKAIINSFDETSKPYVDACNSCSNCPYRKLTQKDVYKKVYHNEKNRYGYRPMLKSNAIKLLLLLHFCHPDKHGIVHDVSASELAAIVQCNVRTVWNNLDILQEYTYISYSKGSHGSLTVILNDYENYYLPAQNGGRGFLVMSRCLLDELISIDSLVSLRICIRELLSLDSPELKGLASVDYKQIGEIRRQLPSYCKPSVIKSKISGSAGLFKVSIDNDIIRFEIDSSYIPKNQKAYVHDKYVNMLTTFLWDFNKSVAYVNSGGQPEAVMKPFFDIDKAHPSYRVFCLSDVELDDLATLALHYSYDYVLNALSVVYKEYFIYDKHVTNLAGLISTIVRSQLNTSKKAA